ncbi:uncharacterized protein LOC125174050 [Prionailurus viverrinus]|uniref:uncharacterized protein LOC125174050 n=1 Tax=Prionailurus viverrinus TaxID=61388 RepID=UPI001FF32710|nr:uncharacterized protein LOC125174050 [Prionailurus viverrinus]
MPSDDTAAPRSPGNLQAEAPERGLAEQKGEGMHVPNCSAENTNLIPTPELWKHLPTAPCADALSLVLITEVTVHLPPPVLGQGEGFQQTQHMVTLLTLDFIVDEAKRQRERNALPFLVLAVRAGCWRRAALDHPGRGRHHAERPLLSVMKRNATGSPETQAAEPKVVSLHGWAVPLRLPHPKAPLLPEVAVGSIRSEARVKEATRRCTSAKWGHTAGKKTWNPESRSSDLGERQRAPAGRWAAAGRTQSRWEQGKGEDAKKQMEQVECSELCLGVGKN